MPSVEDPHGRHTKSTHLFSASHGVFGIALAINCINKQLSIPTRIDRIMALFKSSVAAPIFYGIFLLCSPHHASAKDLCDGLEANIAIERKESILHEDGFSTAEIQGILFNTQREARAFAAKVKADSLQPHEWILTGNEFESWAAKRAGKIKPEQALRIWPFLQAELAPIKLHEELWLKTILHSAKNGDRALLGVFARWSPLMGKDLKQQKDIKDALAKVVIAELEKSPEKSAIAIATLFKEFQFSKSQQTKILRLLEDSPAVLQFLNFVDPQSLPLEFVRQINHLWKIPDTALSKLDVEESAISLVKHTDYRCGQCAFMMMGHRGSLIEGEKRIFPTTRYGRAILIRLNGKIIGSVKGSTDPSFLALRNVRSAKTSQNILWAGGVYQTDSTLAKLVRIQLENFEDDFPVIDVKSITLKPLTFLNTQVSTDNTLTWPKDQYKKKFLGLQQNLSQIMKAAEHQ